MVLVGSSPRSRGTLSFRHDGSLELRFIPALAGNTNADRGTRGARAVHPRARGEHARRLVLAEAERGSSPRSRGTLTRDFGITEDNRFIPALAGNTFPMTSSAIFSTGSSPRSRGTHVVRVGSRLWIRFIPALAGNTNRGVGSRARGSVHPRARGEHLVHVRFHHFRSGSSPRSRGTRCLPSIQATAIRFIPALAGNTMQGETKMKSKTVHPRARGEHSVHQTRTAEDPGSSPRSRGTLPHTMSSTGTVWFIPALAGNTCFADTTNSTTPVHPRARGEHSGRQSRTSLLSGSSPRSRGTRNKQEPVLILQRFIPALAGNTLSGVY